MNEDRIRDRAYAIWEREGCPDGHHEAHWEQARRELEDEERRGRERAGGDQSWLGEPRLPEVEELGADDLLHPSGRNAGTLRPAAEAMGVLEESPEARGRSRVSGESDDSVR